LIPPDGFNEWPKTAKPKLPFAIAMKDGRPPNQAAWLGETDAGNLKALLLPTLPARCFVGNFSTVSARPVNK